MTKAIKIKALLLLVIGLCTQSTMLNCFVTERLTKVWMYNTQYEMDYSVKKKIKNDEILSEKEIKHAVDRSIEHIKADNPRALIHYDSDLVRTYTQHKQIRNNPELSALLPTQITKGFSKDDPWIAKLTFLLLGKTRTLEFLTWEFLE